jgi:hypothetical protein
MVTHFEKHILWATKNHKHRHQYANNESWGLRADSGPSNQSTESNASSHRFGGQFGMLKGSFADVHGVMALIVVVL